MLIFTFVHKSKVQTSLKTPVQQSQIFKCVTNSCSYSFQCIMNNTNVKIFQWEMAAFVCRWQEPARRPEVSYLVPIKWQNWALNNKSPIYKISLKSMIRGRWIYFYFKCPKEAASTSFIRQDMFRLSSKSTANHAPASCLQSQAAGSDWAVWRGGCWDVLVEGWRAGYATWGWTGQSRREERDTTMM